MSYKTIKEHLARKHEAVENLLTFLGKEYSYSEIMSMMAIDQTGILKLYEISNIHGYKESIEEITEFLVAVQCLLINLEDLSEIAKEEMEKGETA